MGDDRIETVNGIIIPSAMALLLSFLLCPISARLSRVIGAIDQPDGIRKIHTLPVPRLGGIGFFTAFFVSSLSLLEAAESTLFALLAGGSIIVAGGIADDAYSISPPVKLLIQISAAAVGVSLMGVPSEFSFLGLFTIALPRAISFIVATVRIVFSINAVNFSDGLDGLAAGISAVALLSVSVFALSYGRGSVFALAIILFFALLGFFPYNKHPARIYMGDSGSQFLGFSIAMLALGARGDGNFAIETLFFLSVPIIDTWFSIIRRLLHGKSPFSADKGHLHHVLLKWGLSHSGAVKVLVCLSGIIASAALIFIGKVR